MSYFISSVVVLVFLFLAVDVLTKLWDYTVDFKTVFIYAIYNIPAILEKILPIATMFAGVLLFSNFSKTNELLAFYSIGKSSFSIILPIFIFVIFVSLSLFYISDKLSSKYLYKSQMLWNTKVLHKKIAITDTNNSVWYKQDKFIVGIEKVFPEERLIKGVKLYQTDNKKIKKVIYSPSAKINKNTLDLKDAKILDLMTNKYIIKESYLAPVSLDQSLVKINDVIYLNNARIKEYANYLEKLKLPAFKYWTEYYKRFSLAFSVIVMFFISISFALFPNRRQSNVSKNISLGIFIVFIYWFLFSTSLSFGAKGLLQPIIAAWFVNILFLLGSTYTLYKKR